MVTPQVYKEVHEILCHMEESTVMKIPLEILERINNNKDNNYVSKINPEDLFNKSNVQRDTIVFIAWLDYNFWANPEEKELLRRTFEKNQINHEEELKNNYYASNKPMFFKEGDSETVAEQTSISIRNNTFLLTLKNFILRIISKLKK